ncbi:sigma-54-dependent Fis family transcriptional regulator [Curvibacter sp. CHRR-16]|uniref:sigma-54-dependent Fis family transcriptional regulator n=1 Tax=Curvibacter sp. CHRR-16 TaxID=2835872 RepID=UPI001BD9DCC5|nr:sigma-54-dependent Fis family transcriptional regulator [Curvibacter sp. CHRR-16]MBT0570559.1 sigma-54-dependent Fis family transcriptional regulator [Curvibacter sp. CHRR-16]
MRSPSTALALRQARQQLLEHGQCPQGLVSEHLLRSWNRCLAAGLLPTQSSGVADYSSGAELRHTLSAHQSLLAHSRPVMEYVFEQMGHSEVVVVLSDPHGTLMHTLGNPAFLGKADRVALSRGANWLESTRGTNAIGTALAECSAVQIHGAEHFLERNSFLTCAASPIVSASGEVMGVLDISGDYRHGHAHALGLAATASRMIENRLMVAHSRGHWRLHLHAQPAGIGSVAEGIVWLNDDGWIMGANRAARGMLQLHAPASVGHSASVLRCQLESLLDVRMADLLAQYHRTGAAVLPLRGHDGRHWFAALGHDTAVVHAGPTVLAGTMATAASAVVGPADAADALAQLDTGDTHWRAATHKVRRVLDKGIPLLIQGETGVGKEWFAKAVHASSARHAGPFVAINCGALGESLVEAELFGYVPGAFTGASRHGSKGRLREAHGGTLFLDEVGDLPLPLQTRLLRVLQERVVVPVGSGQAYPVDFALLCATHHGLQQAVEQGRFRADLYYRLNGLTVQLPALRERTDWDALVQRLLAQYGASHAAHATAAVQLSPEVDEALRRYAWPGNVRQLGNVLRTACAMLLPHERCIGWEHLPDDLVQALQGPDGVAPANPAHPAAWPNLQQLSRTAIETALQQCQGNVSQAARLLGISRQTLYRKLHKH